jgi:carboxypeptidase Q
MNLRLPLLVSCCALATLSLGQSGFDARLIALKTKGLHELGAYSLLGELSGGIGARLSGSPKAAEAVQWGQRTMERLGFQNVHLVPCMVPHWVRGDRQELTMADSSGGNTPLTICTLGGSIATPAAGIQAQVIEVHSLDEAGKLGDQAKGKILFFNRGFDPTLTNTFEAYGGAVDQRFGGAVVAGRIGAVGVLVRSMTLDPDDVPHTGAMGYRDGVAKVPAVALSIVAANKLSEALKRNPNLTVNLNVNPQTLPDEPSASVVGEITGTEKPNEVIVMGGHLDSWDLGRGAHDDGAGVTQSLEALRLLKELGWKPKRTIRVVLFMNEENGGRGAKAYAAYAKTAKEKHIAALESDSGGFAPLGFGTSLKRNQIGKVNRWLPALAPFEINHFTPEGEGGADVDPLGPLGAVVFGLEPESQRYFDYHHSDKDTIDKVNPRELELGAMSMAMLVWLISENGV